jgi:hypothetical protein
MLAYILPFSNFELILRGLQPHYHYFLQLVEKENKTRIYLLLAQFRASLYGNIYTVL